MTLFCITYAFAAVQLESDLSWVCVLIYVLAVVCTQEVAQCLADPFGSDVTDLPLDSYWKQTKTTLDTLVGANHRAITDLSLSEADPLLQDL